jgi:hypothetical protein
MLSLIRLLMILIGFVLLAVTLWIAQDVYAHGVTVDKLAENSTKVVTTLLAAVGGLFALAYGRAGAQKVAETNAEASLSVAEIKAEVDKYIGEMNADNLLRNTALKGVIDHQIANLNADALLANTAFKAAIDTRMLPYVKQLEVVAEFRIHNAAHASKKWVERDDLLTTLLAKQDRVQKVFAKILVDQNKGPKNDEDLIAQLSLALAARQEYIDAIDKLTEKHLIHPDHLPHLDSYRRQLIQVIIDVKRDVVSSEEASAMKLRQQKLADHADRCVKILEALLDPQFRRYV